MNNIKLVRLITGEVLAGTYEETGSSSFRIKNPLLLGIAPDPATGKLIVTMMPYMPFSKDEQYDFNNQHVLGIFDPTDDLAREVHSKTSKIFVPSKPQLIV